MKILKLSYFVKLSIFLIFPFLCFGQEKEQKEKPKLDLGGALRFNYIYSSWKEEQKTKGGEFGYDMFRINAKASYKGIFLNAEYRLYSEAFGGGFLKQGWIGYKFNEGNHESVATRLTSHSGPVATAQQSHTPSSIVDPR